jgi:hypothetical protein
LVGGIEAVTLSDEEARRRGTQKTVLERRAPPTFDVLIEIQNRDRFSIHMDIMAAVDALLRGYPLPAEIRMRDADGQIKIEKATPAPKSRIEANGKNVRRGPEPFDPTPGKPASVSQPGPVPQYDPSTTASRASLKPIRIYPYGVARNRLMQAAKRLGVPADVVREVNDADALVTLRSYYRNRQRIVVDAENRGMPIYVLRSNTVNQMEQFLSDLFNLVAKQAESGELDYVRQQTQQAIQGVLNGERWVDLPPGPSLVRRLQHEMARSAELTSHSYGKEPRRHVRIFRE